MGFITLLTLSNLDTLNCLFLLSLNAIKFCLDTSLLTIIHHERKVCIVPILKQCLFETFISREFEG